MCCSMLRDGWLPRPDCPGGVQGEHRHHHHDRRCVTMSVRCNIVITLIILSSSSPLLPSPLPHHPPPYHPYSSLTTTTAIPSYSSPMLMHGLCTQPPRHLVCIYSGEGQKNIISLLIFIFDFLPAASHRGRPERRAESLPGTRHTRSSSRSGEGPTKGAGYDRPEVKAWTDPARCIHHKQRQPGERVPYISRVQEYRISPTTHDYKKPTRGGISTADSRSSSIDFYTHIKHPQGTEDHKMQHGGDS
jgi:hypothetical protein